MVNGEGLASRPDNGRISRRSCDRCRYRKIACDRSTPCSNCVSARLNCTHSAVASNVTAPKQRVLISTQYERKIDEIAKDIESIKRLLQNGDSVPRRPEPPLPQSSNNRTPAPGSQDGDIWDHSKEVIDYVKAVVADRDSTLDAPDADSAVNSLKQALNSMEDNSTSLLKVPCLGLEIARSQPNPVLPPLEVVLMVLRWGQEHSHYSRIEFISRILPLHKFTESCRNVFFPVSDYSEIDFVLANGYIYNVLSEYMIAIGSTQYRKYYDLCRTTFINAIARLPLLLPATSEVVAALTLGAFGAIEHSKGHLAWNFISSALNLCQSLGYHRSQHVNGNLNDKEEASVQRSLFWTIYTLERGLALRLGRASHIRDEEITLPFDSGPRDIKAARIQGKVYDQLYSPVGLSRTQRERANVAQPLVEELRGIIDEADAEVMSAMQSRSTDSTADPTRVLLLQCHLLCHYSLLVLLLRAIPTHQSSYNSISDECISVARHCLDIHMQCIEHIRNSNSDPLLVAQYINWPIIHMPFVPFIVIVTSAVQASDGTDLSRLEAFVESLKPSEPSPVASTHPYRMYGLLCQIARSSIESSSLAFSDDLFATFGDIDFSTHFGMAAEEGFGVEEAQFGGLSGWYHNNLHMMSLLDGNSTFQGI